MNPVQGCLLGLVQGLTEFLPVSSSGHLVLVGRWLGVHDEGQGAATEALLHLGTLLAVIVHYRRDLVQMIGTLGQPRRVWRPAAEDRPARLAQVVIIATFITGSLGLLLADPLERLFDSPRAVAVGLLTTTLLLWYSGRARFQAPPSPAGLRPRSALAVGLAQTVAIVPGISRSGAPIVAGLTSGIARSDAGACSFLIAIPAVVGAALLQLVRHPPTSDDILPALLGIAVAFVSGLLALRWTLACLEARRLHYFAPYTLLLAVAAFLLG